MTKHILFLLILELENRLRELEGLSQTGRPLAADLTQNSNVLYSGPACHNTAI